MGGEKVNKKTLILSITAILIVIISFSFMKFGKLKLNLDTTNIHSFEYNLLDGGEMKHKEITNKENISKVIEYLNSLSLPKTSLRPKDASNSFYFKDDNGNVIKSFAFGESGVLWADSKTYKLGNSNINNLKNLLTNLDK